MLHHPLPMTPSTLRVCGIALAAAVLGSLATLAADSVDSARLGEVIGPD
jgi:hypothetical protein